MGWMVQISYDHNIDKTSIMMYRARVHYLKYERGTPHGNRDVIAAS